VWKRYQQCNLPIKKLRKSWLTRTNYSSIRNRNIIALNRKSIHEMTLINPSQIFSQYTRQLTSPWRGEVTMLAMALVH
jgi:hypothetical protein